MGRILQGLGATRVSRCMKRQRDQPCWLAPACKILLLLLLLLHEVGLLQAHTLGLVDDIGLQRVVNSASNDLRWARARYASQGGIRWDRVIKQLNIDIRFANERLPDDKQASRQTAPSVQCGV